MSPKREGRDASFTTRPWAFVRTLQVAASYGLYLPIYRLSAWGLQNGRGFFKKKTALKGLIESSKIIRPGSVLGAMPYRPVLKLVVGSFLGHFWRPRNVSKINPLYYSV